MGTALVIAGPTASGKSAAALELARLYGGEIVNADAMQVYADLRILTARPSAEEERAVSHHLYGVSSGDDPWSAGRYARNAAAVIEGVLARGRLPIVVGGTGLWLRALTEGLSPIPDVPADVLAECEADLDEQGLALFRDLVVRDDPAMARLDPNDRQRHVRAAAVRRATGRSLSAWQGEAPVQVTETQFIRMALIPPREESHRAVRQRLDRMVEAGALEEVRALLAREYSCDMPVMKSVGVPEFAAYLAEEVSLEDAVERTVVATRQLVKRQTTWLRGQFGSWPRATTQAGLIELATTQLA